tara:strand:+ start:2638 stop:3078 length:441 start_codon:yes stop_codon:yes gene_type:complete
MIEEICKQDAKWRKIAFSMCNDKMLADDLVQEAYLYLLGCGKDVPKNQQAYFVTRVLWSKFIDYTRKRKDVSLSEFYYLKSIDNTFEPTDEQQRILDNINNLDWVKKELLAESYDRSLREIQEIYGINYGYVYRQVKEAKKIVIDD